MHSTQTDTDSAYPMLVWQEGEVSHTARWRAENGATPPKRVMIADDTLTADSAFRFASEGTAMLWRGDFNNARQLLLALARRIDKKPLKRKEREASADGVSPSDAFNRHRQLQSQRARTLGMILIELAGDYQITLRRAPNLQEACTEVYGEPAADALSSVVSLRELLGLIGAHEWRKKGVPVGAAGGNIHPYYGVFSPVRGEYVDLVNKAPIPAGCAVAWDIGTGTGVLAAVLARRGIEQVVATDNDARALACARNNLAQLGLSGRIEVLEADLFPSGQAGLIVCNPPWIPARPSTPVEHAIYDPESRMLKGFLAGLAAHLTPGGEGWLIMSDIAEHLGLRTRDSLLADIDAAGLTVLERRSTKPTHARASDENDPLHAARSAEITTLWRLTAKPAGQ